MDTTSLPPDDRPPVAGPRRVNRGLLWASALAVVVLAIATIVAFTAGDGGSKAGDVQAIDPNGTPPVDGSLTGARRHRRGPPGRLLQDLRRRRGAAEHRAASRCSSTSGRRPALPCIKEMPDLESIYQANSGSLGFLGLQVSERAESGLQMIERTGHHLPDRP